MRSDGRSRPCYGRAVPNNQLVRIWSVDFASGRAACGTAVLQFRHCLEQGTQIAFVEGGDASLEAQCELAGEAIAAIQRAGLCGV